MIRVLFVCLGNICRSPMAEAVFASEVNKRGLTYKIQCESAGTGSWHIGNHPHEEVRNILDEHGIYHEGLVARQFTASDFDTFDFIIAMDDSNVSDIKKLKGEVHRAEVKRFAEFVPNEEVREVPDPYYTGNFEEVFAIIKEGCDHLLEFIIKKYNL